MTFCRTELESMGVSPEVLEARALRRRLKVTQREFAAMADVSLSAIYHFELGEGNKPKQAAKIRALLERWREKPPEQRKETRGGRREKKTKPQLDTKSVNAA